MFEIKGTFVARGREPQVTELENEMEEWRVLRLRGRQEADPAGHGCHWKGG